MASPSITMLSNVSMERLYLSQPPGWNDLQRLSYSLTQSQQQQQQQSQQDNRSNHQLFRTCYDKLLHHMYDINSSSSLTTSTTTTTSTINQINEQLELAAEYCQLKTYRDGNTVYLHSDQFHLEVNFDPITHLPTNIASCFLNEEPLICTNMLKALNEKQYKLFREHLNGYAHLFTLIAPNLNNEKRIGYMTYKILQQDLERLSKTDVYGKLFEGFQPMFEGLPMSIKLGNESDSIHLRIIIVPSANQHYLPIKTSLYLDEKTNTMQIDSSLKSSTLATGHFALEFDEHQPAFTFLQTFAQEISRLTNISTFLSSDVKTFNYLSTILPKTRTLHHYHWYMSQDQPAVSIRQIPFTNLKQLIQILSLIRQQIYLTKHLNLYFNHPADDEQDHMEEEHSSEILFELSLLSSTILSITSAQEQYLSTFLLKMSDIENLPVLIDRFEQKEYELINEKNSLFALVEKLLQQTTHTLTSSSSSPPKIEPLPIEQPTHTSPIPPAPPKLNRRLSCVPPAKPTWRRATTLRRNQPACLTLNATREKSTDEPMVDDEINPNVPTEDFPDEDDDDDPFLQLTEQQLQTQQSYHTPILPKPLLSFHPSTLSRCTLVSSTQSVSTPPISGLSPSTPYPGGANNPNGNVFFPLGKQISVPEYSPVSSPITMGTLDPLAFLPANSLPQPPTNDPNNKNPQQKKKRRRSEHSADDFIQTLNNDNRSSMAGTKLNTSGGTDPSNIKRGKKPTDKNPQQQQQQQLVRQKSAFKVTDSPTTTLLSQQSVTSPDDASNELKPLKVVIKRVEGGGSVSTDESQQQQTIKQRKKQQQQAQQMANNGGSSQGTMRKVPLNNSGGASAAVVVKTESIDVPQLGSDSNSMMSSGDGSQQPPRERPRPSSSLSNPSSSLSALAASQPRSAPPQPPIVLKIQRSKVYSGQEQTSSSTASTPTTATSTPGASQPSNSIPSALKEALKHRARSMPTGANTTKSQVTSPPNLAAKLTSPSTGTTSNPLAPPSSVTSLFRIPRKSSSQEVTAKPKTEPGTLPPANNNTSPIVSKTPLIPGPGVRPSLPPTQVGSWQSPPTQQPSRFNQNRPRSSWSQQAPPRARVAITPPNVSAMNAGHSALNNFSQQPRSILKKPPSNEGSGSDLHFMPASDLSGFNDPRIAINFSGSTAQNRTATSTEMYDDNDDDTSPQAQLVIDTSSNTANNALLPYTIVPGSSSSTGMDSYDPMHENSSMMNSSQQHMGDESFSNLD